MNKKENCYNKTYSTDSHDRAKTTPGLFFVLIFLLTVFAAPVFAELGAEENAMLNARNKTIQGEVGAHNSQGFALITEENLVAGTQKEIWFPYEENLQLIGYANREDMTEGDRVVVAYDESVDGSLKRLRSINVKSRVEPQAEAEAPVEEPAAEEEAAE